MIMWSLYAALFLLVMLLQTSLFGRLRFFGVKLSLVPVVLVCISAFIGHEAGGIFSLIAAVVWYLSGAEDGPIFILTMTISGIAAGFVCDLFSHRFLPTLGLCLGAILFHEGVVFLMRYYLGTATGTLILWVLKMAGLSLVAWPPCYLLAKVIRKAGA